MTLDSSVHEDPEKEPSINDYASFDPKQYIREYYSTLGSENAFLLEFHHRVHSTLKTGGRLLEFGGGPSVYQILSASRVMREIVFAEYLACNRREVLSWLYSGPDAADWTAYLDYVLRLEAKEPNDESRRELKERVTSRLTQIVECDATLPNILSPRSFSPFDAVSSNFCLECITGREEEFIEFLLKLSRVLRPGGTLVLTLLKNAASYRVGPLFFPAVRIDENFMGSALKEMGFTEIDITTEPAEANQGYSGVIALTAVRE